ncbi:MAG: AlpA family transcriptional regulator [Comamonas sp.]|nr:AlpA family transcriptional regulator [Comamonas sp.]
MNTAATKPPKKASSTSITKPSSRQTERLLRINDVCQATGLARSTVYAKLQQNDFPKPVRLHGKCVAWKASEIDAWISALPRAVM